MVACLLWYFFRSRHKFALFIVSVFMVTIVLGLSGQEFIDRISTISVDSEELDYSSASRIVLWHAATLIFFDNPVTGSGLLTSGQAKLLYKNELQGQYDDDLLDYTFNGQKVIHSTYFIALAEGGLLLFMPFMIFILQFFYRNKKARKMLNSKNAKMIYLLNSIEAGVFGYCVSILFVPVLFSVLFPMQIVCGGILSRLILEDAEVADNGILRGAK